MSGDLIISGGGSFAVSTDEMLSSASRLQRAAEMSREIAGAIQMVDARLTRGHLESLGIPSAAAYAEHDLECAFKDLQAFACRADVLTAVVRVAAQSYGMGEAFVEGLTRRVAAEAAALLGFLFPTELVVTAGVVIVVPVVAGIAAAAFLTGRNPADIQLSEQFSTALNELITDPVFVRTMRFAVMNADEFMAGASGLPPGLVASLSAAGLIGLSSSAGTIKQLGGVAGVFRETPVTLKTTTTPKPVEPAQSFEERIARIPQPTLDAPWQVRIETISTPGQADRFEVYISGTVDFAVADSEQPWDGSSNIDLAAARDSASIAAVAAAMQEAGITTTSAVSFTGHSQGAAVAARLVESEEYNAVGLLTVGGNIGQISLPPDVPAVIVEHSDDIVVAAGGLQDNHHALLVERQAYEGRPLPEGVPAPAHQAIEYQRTARLMDASDSPELQRAWQQLAPPAGSTSTATVTNFEYVREKP
ncbi:hypothetical protein AB0O95_01740 [Rhodoglobus sp. NPDC076762]